MSANTLSTSRRLLMVAAIFCGGAALHAQTIVTAAAGVSVPLGSTADTYNTGSNAAIGFGMKPPFSSLGVRVEGMFNQFESTDADPYFTRTVAVIANAMLSTNPSMPVSIGYLIGGVGVYNTKNSVDRPGLSSGWNSDFGFNGGAGLNVPLGGVEAFLEARFHLITTEGASVKFIPIAFGIKF